MQIPFITVDVFTDRKFGGNPLAVVPDGRALTGAQMQAIAGEFNLAETTFVLTPQDPAHTAEVRIFTPGIPEDAASGSANVALAGLLASLRAESDLSLKFRIGQGIDMGRPSLLEASAEKRGGKIIGMSIGGRCVPMMRGVLEL